jgi:hypothetical protein
MFAAIPWQAALRAWAQVAAGVVKRSAAAIAALRTILLI